MENVAQFLTSDFFSWGSSVIILFLPFFLRGQHDRVSLQSIATSAGIFGTFLGIFGGMMRFNVENIEASIPILLGGLSTAFLTSIAGTFASLIVKIKPSIYGIQESIDGSDEEDKNALMLEELKNVTKSLVGGEDSTLLTQIQKLRTEMSDKQGEMNASFKEFATKIVESNSDALIVALTQVMNDFNVKITEHIGDNFKQLNEGIGQMLVWQENYRHQIETAVGILEASSRSLENSSEAIEKNAKYMEDLTEVFSKMQKELDGVANIMGGIKSLSEVLSKSGETIRKEMQDLTERNLEFLAGQLLGISKQVVDDYSILQKEMHQFVSAMSLNK